MMKLPTTHFNIPIFIPELACPNRCVFCNQFKISGSLVVPQKEELERIIETYLSSILKKEGTKQIEIAFFGGNFTGLAVEEQEKYLQWAEPYFQSGDIQGIRLSTRPDYVNQNKLDLLKKYHVKAIELGVQSLDDEVLKLSGRGHTLIDVENAVKLIHQNDFELGLQMMIGLPGDNALKALKTAQKIVSYKPDTARIYPTLVIKDTRLEDMYLKGIYRPLTLEDAINQTKDIYQIIDNAGIRIIRTGLHPSEELINKKNYLAGPFHISFKELVLTEIWKDLFLKFEFIRTRNNVCIYVPSTEINYAVGYKASNKHWLQSLFEEVKFKADPKLKNREFYVDYC